MLAEVKASRGGEAAWVSIIPKIQGQLIPKTAEVVIIITITIC